jgi:hypothetical protein
MLGLDFVSDLQMQSPQTDLAVVWRAVVMVHVRPWLELLYFVAGIIVAPALIYGLQQVTLLKRDIRIRTERSSKEKAIEFASRYLNTYTQLDGRFSNTCRTAQLQSYDGEIGDFTSASIYKNKRQLLLTTKRYELESWLPAMNELETIAAAFTTGVADEQTGFRIIGRSFCISVKSEYDLIALSRQKVITSNDYWRNIVELYKIWSPRLRGSDLRDLRDNLDARIAASATRGGTIKPIGAE